MNDEEKKLIKEAFYHAAIIMGTRIKGMSCYVNNWKLPSLEKLNDPKAS
jgi:hypothetical protein